MERSAVLKSMPVFDSFDPSLQTFPQKTTIRATSCSSNLKRDEGSRKFEDSEISIFDAQKYFNESDNPISKRVSAGSPPPLMTSLISERCEDLPSFPRFSSASSSVDGNGRNYRARSFHATPTASSEASWNSQTGLLSKPPGAFAVSLRNLPPSHDKRRRSAKKWLLARRCPCSGKKSVEVEDPKQSESRSPSRTINLNPNVSSNNQESVEKAIDRKFVEPDWPKRRETIQSSNGISSDSNHFAKNPSHHHKLASSTRPFIDSTNGFTFPILAGTSTPVMKVLLNEKPPIDEPPRDSLEVYKPPTTHTKRQSFSFPSSPKSRIAAIDDDIASDASSDLFEIESFSTQTTSYPTPTPIYPNNNINRRDSLDEARNYNARISSSNNLYCNRQSLDEPMTPSISPTECYAPSEVSIDWSVTTAEGFDKASVVTSLSVITTPEGDQETTFTRFNEVGKRKGGGYGGLLSCRCEKAVSVGPQPVKCGATEGQRGMNSTMKHVSGRPPQGLVYKPQLARSHSARLSLPFET